ncbi:hypothetical protein AB4853_41160 [Bradyrhizobium sp. 1050_B9_N1_2]|uniref:hypothetical protein n=1 Tax=Bradyrhizobium sp. 1050_B9_N1_2 TaxID=3238688 RepID=UPI003EDBD32F
MKTITVTKGGEGARSIYVRNDGDVTVFDRDHEFRFRTDIAEADTTWQILARVVPAIVHAETVHLKIDALVDRCRAGWRPGYPDEIDPDIPQRTLRRARFALLRYPDDNESYSRSTILMESTNGQIQATGEIVWIDADREWVVREDYFWWTPVE